MKEIEEKDLDTAMALGNAICDELGICCEKRGEVIFKVYKKLQELKPQMGITDQPEQGAEQPEENAPTSVAQGDEQQDSEKSRVGSEEQYSLPE